MIQDIEQKVDVEIVFALLSGKVTNAVNRTLSQNLKENNIEISPAQVSILYTLWREDGLTQKQLSDYTAKDKPSITRLLDNMEKIGLIARKQDKTDRRTNRIFLTKRAGEVKGTIRKATVEALQEGLKGMNDKDLGDVQRLLKMIYSNIGKYAEE
ncbi:MAG: MarR family transcriptional regulator [Paludibacteraceae bacterium]|nr:MarR family transcriptional regulator [Candidatus Physcocola equi]MCQ2234337.1 MarR family transcriptional regulator [Paludibacteraceae bacterium]